MREFMAMTKALADESRTRVLMFLRGGELCVCQIIEMLGLAPSTVSKHMAILYQARLVESRKEGRWTYYRLPEESAAPGALETIGWLADCLAKDAQVIEDARHLKAVRKMSKEQLCGHYRN